MIRGVTDSQEIYSWFPRLNSRPGARLRLYCFPYAGSGASIYYPWHKLLPNTIEVCPIQLPGREERLNDPCIEDFDNMVARILPLIVQTIDRPFAIYGHSLGGCLGYKVARMLCNLNHTPVYYFAGAHRSPCIPYYYPKTKGCSDTELITMVKRFNGMPETVTANQEIMAIMLPILRNDLSLCESFQYKNEGKLACPIMIFNGAYDENVTSDKLAPWKEHSTKNVDFVTLDGGHFFIKTHAEELVGNIVSALGQEMNIY